MGNSEKKYIQVSKEIAISGGGRALGYDLKGSIMEMIDNFKDANNTHIFIKIDSEGGKTEIIGDLGVTEDKMDKIISYGVRDKNFDSVSIGNYGLGGFMSITLLGEKGLVTVESILDGNKVTFPLDFTDNNKDKMSFDPKRSSNVESANKLSITCLTRSLDIFHSIDQLEYELGAHYCEMIKGGFKIFLSINPSKAPKLVEPIDHFYMDVSKRWNGSKSYNININSDLSIDIDIEGRYIPKDVKKNNLDKKGKRGLPVDYQGVYLKYNGRILELGSGWGYNDMNNRLSSGRMLLNINTKGLTKEQKTDVLDFFGITANKNKPTFEITSKSSKEKLELGKIINQFKNWVDEEYMSSRDVKTPKTKVDRIDEIKNHPLISANITSLQNYHLIEEMCPQVIKGLKELQELCA